MRYRVIKLADMPPELWQQCNDIDMQSCYRLIVNNKIVGIVCRVRGYFNTYVGFGMGNRILKQGAWGSLEDTSKMVYEASYGPRISRFS